MSYYDLGNGIVRRAENNVDIGPILQRMDERADDLKQELLAFKKEVTVLSAETDLTQALGIKKSD